MSGLAIRTLELPAPAYAGFTFPYFAAQLSALAPPNVVALALEDAGEPAGLGLARVEPAAGTADVLSLFVAAPHRGQGWGTRLLAGLETAVRAAGARQIRVVYVAGAGTPALEAVLRKCGWEPPVVRMILCKTDAAHILHAPWIKSARLGPGLEMFPWRELPPEMRAWIQAREGTPGWHPPTLSPFKDEPYYDPETSLGLRSHGELAGWVITHRVIPGSLRYTTVFVREDLRWRAPHLPMVAEVIRRQMASSYYADTPYGMFNQPVDDPAVHRFFVKRLQDYVISTKESKGSWKRLP